MSHIRWRRELRTEFWWGIPKEEDHFEDVGIDERIILKFILKKGDGKALAGLIWLRIGTGGGLWCTL
jgi:hypothetical protein